MENLALRASFNTI